MIIFNLLFVYILTNPPQLSNIGRFKNIELTLYWEFYETYFDFMFQWKNNSEWVGIGFNKKMFPTYMWILQFQNNLPIITEYYSSQHYPQQLSQQYIFNISNYSQNQYYYIKFSRNYTISNSQVFNLTKDQQYELCCAFGDKPTLNYHNNNKFDFNFNFKIFNGYFQSNNYKLIHGIGLTVCWYLLGFIGLFFSRYFRYFSHYINLHSITMIFSILMTISFVTIMLIDHNYIFIPFNFINQSIVIQIHFIIGIAILLILIFIGLGGLYMRSKLQSIKTISNLRDYKLAHMIFGYSIYLIASSQCIFGWYIKQTPNLYIFYIILSLFILEIIIKIIVQVGFRKDIYFPCLKFLCYKIQTPRLYDGIIQLIQNNTHKNQIRKQFPHINFVIFKNKLIDLTGFNHPGGKFLIQQLYGQQISRYIYGGHSLQTTTIQPHNHSNYSLKIIQQNKAGYIKNNFPFQFLKNSQLIQQQTKQQGKILSSIKRWKCVNKINLSSNIVLFYFYTDIFKIKQFSSLKELGKYFLVKMVDYQKIRTYTCVLSYTEKSIEFRNNLLNKFQNPSISNNQQTKNLQQKFPFIIKIYEHQKALSYNLNNKPLQQLEIIIQGPLGKGLQIQQDGSYYILAGGSGIFPFLDLIDIILKVTINRIKNQENNLISKFDNEIGNKKFILYCSFKNNQEAKIYQWIKFLDNLCVNHKLNIFKYFPIISQKIKTKYQGQIISQIKQNENHIKKVWICGPPKLIRQTYACLIEKNFNKDKISIL